MYQADTKWRISKKDTWEFFTHSSTKMKSKQESRLKLAGHFWWHKLCMYSGHSLRNTCKKIVFNKSFFIFSFYLITIFFRALVELSNSRKQFSFATINPCHSPSWIRRTRIVILSNFQFPSIFNAVLKCPVVFLCFFFDKGKLVVCPDKA